MDTGSTNGAKHQRLSVKTRMTKNGRVTIPEAFRKELGITPDDDLLMIIEDGELHIFTTSHGVKRAQAIVRQYFPEGYMASEELMAERRAEAARE